MPLKVVFGQVQLAFRCTFIYLFGINFVVLDMVISVKRIEMVAGVSGCGGHDTVGGDFIFQLSFWGIIVFAVVLGSVK